MGVCDAQRSRWCGVAMTATARTLALFTESFNSPTEPLKRRGMPVLNALPPQPPLASVLLHQPVKQLPTPSASASTTRNYSLRRLTRNRLTHHLNPYKKQKQVKANDAPKTCDESDSLLSFPSTSTASTPNEHGNVPIEKVLEDAQYSMRLQLMRRELKQIPSHLTAHLDLADMLLLDLSSNSLIELPEFLGRLPRLRTLTARLNRIGPRIEIPFQSLVYLDLSSNRISALNLSGAPLLRILLVAGNRLTMLDPTIVHLASLEELDVSSNLISTLPKEIGALKNLRVLNLSDNRIRQLPAETGSLEHLFLFDASQNQLERLPSSLWRIAANTRAQVTFRVDGNPLTTPPLDIVRRGRQHIGKFLRKLAASESGNNSDDFLNNAYELEFYRSHGICNDKTSEQRRQILRKTEVNGSPSIVRRYGMENGCGTPPLNMPLSVNTVGAPTVLSMSGATVVCGTDSGYASTVDEHRLSHEFANNVLTDNNAIDHRIHDMRHDNAAPTIPPLDLTSVDTTELPIIRARTNSYTSKSIIRSCTENGKPVKSTDSNNNDSYDRNNNSVKEENSNHRAETDRNGTVAINRPIRFRYNTVTIKDSDGNKKNEPSPPMSMTTTANRILRNGNLLSGLHSSINGTNNATVLSPLVERNESSWSSTTGELPPAPPSLSTIGNNASVCVKPANSITEKPVVNKIQPVTSKESIVASKIINEKSANAPPTANKTTAPYSSTLPRKRITTTAKATNSASNSSDNLTKLVKTSSVMNPKSFNGSTSKLTRGVVTKSSASSSFATTSAAKSQPNGCVRPAANVTMKTSVTTKKPMTISSSVNSKALDKSALEVKSVSTNKISRSVVTSMPKASGVSTTNKRLPNTTSTSASVSARATRGSSTAPQMDKSSSISQKSASSLHLARKVAPVSAIPATSRSVTSRAALGNTKRN